MDILLNQYVAHVEKNMEMALFVVIVVVVLCAMTAMTVLYVHFVMTISRAMIAKKITSSDLERGASECAKCV